MSTPPPDAPSTRWPLAWAVLLTLCVVMQGWIFASDIPFGQPPDEIAHASYVRDATAGPKFMPDYASGTIGRSGRGNYLGHPPLYYSILAAYGKLSGADPVRDFLGFRRISLLFVGLGFFFSLASARRLGVGLVPCVVATAAVCATPLFAYVAGSINNDTLAYLGVSLFLYGAARSRLESARLDLPGVASLTLGLVVAALTKATAATFLVFLVATFSLLRWRTLPALARDRRLQAGVAISLVIVGGYYAWALTTFGTPLPKPAALYDVSPPADPFGVAAYIAKYAGSMWERLPVVLSHASISPYNALTRVFFYAMFVAPVAGWLLMRPGASSRGVERSVLALTDAFLVALIATVIVHIVYVRGSYLTTGLFAGWQPRYFLFALPFVWFPFFALRPGLSARYLVSAAFALSTCLAFWTSVPRTLSEHAKGESTRREAAASQRAGASITLPARPQPEMAVVLTVGGKARGHVDDFSMERGSLRVRGWAFDTRANRRVRRIVVIAQGRYLGSVDADLPRPDVAKALQNPKAARTGFELVIHGVPQPLDPCSILVASELSDGRLAAMRTEACPSPPADRS